MGGTDAEPRRGAGGRAASAVRAPRGPPTPRSCAPRSAAPRRPSRGCSPATGRWPTAPRGWWSATAPPPRTWPRRRSSPRRGRSSASTAGGRSRRGCTGSSSTARSTRPARGACARSSASPSRRCWPRDGRARARGALTFSEARARRAGGALAGAPRRRRAAPPARVHAGRDRAAAGPPARAPSTRACAARSTRWSRVAARGGAPDERASCLRARAARALERAGGGRRPRPCARRPRWRPRRAAGAAAGPARLRPLAVARGGGRALLVLALTPPGEAVADWLSRAVHARPAAQAAAAPPATCRAAAGCSSPPAAQRLDRAPRRPPHGARPLEPRRLVAARPVRRGAGAAAPWPRSTPSGHVRWSVRAPARVRAVGAGRRRASTSVYLAGRPSSRVVERAGPGRLAAAPRAGPARSRARTPGRSRRSRPPSARAPPRTARVRHRRGGASR